MQQNDEEKESPLSRGMRKPTDTVYDDMLFLEQISTFLLNREPTGSATRDIMERVQNLLNWNPVFFARAAYELTGNKILDEKAES